MADSSAMISALAAVFGSLVGALGSSASAWIAQRHQDRRELIAKKVSALERLYSDFINEGARLLIDALQHSLEDATTLARIYALLSRIRLSSSTDVIESGEQLIETILRTYFEPNLTQEEIQAAANTHNDHLQEFSSMCRRELESVGKGF